MRNNIFVPGKLEYARGEKRPDVECILCAIVDGSDEVEKLEVYRSGFFVVSLNIYPYTPGHMMIFPKRHIVDIRELSDDEILELHKVRRMCLDVLDKVYTPHGYNLGYNMGDAAGASIQHLHLHIVPRYRKETGFIDIIAGSKIVVEDPNVSLAKVKKAFTEK